MHTASTSSLRYERLDVLRAVAIVWMAIFHLAFDLNHFRFIQENFRGDPFWTLQRTAIVSLFLFCAGVSQAVAQHHRQSWPRFWRRWAQIAGCAVLVSVGSALMFPGSWISFGVLHGVAVMLVIVRVLAPLANRGAIGLTALLALAAVALWLPPTWGHGFFDSRATNWVGLITRRPITEDYVPVLPWLGVMLLGFVAGSVVLSHRAAWLTGPIASSMRPMARLGQWSLSFYMLHQPVLIGGLLLFMWLAGRPA